MRRSNPEAPRCGYCDQRCRNQNDASVHESTCPSKLADDAERARRFPQAQEDRP